MGGVVAGFGQAGEVGRGAVASVELVFNAQINAVLEAGVDVGGERGVVGSELAGNLDEVANRLHRHVVQREGDAGFRQDGGLGRFRCGVGEDVFAGVFDGVGAGRGGIEDFFKAQDAEGTTDDAGLAVRGDGYV